ncbi:hypothetical protein ACFFOS_19230 [Nocardioides kongjuensis]|uniref:Uncharacterized protein n=1 Tax=Nocardioides kongjuensis TaxID=349522 RepID=A0A852RDT5_9ACTN|nr:hypothetical protein [Nocardioides kongjuensis]NYD29405.1 hypothetical protein [Nocardioides kongjuensis]
MLIFLTLPVIASVVAVRSYLQVYAPTNLLVRRVRAQEPRWRTVAVLFVISAALLVAMHSVEETVDSGGSSLLNLVVLVLAWDAIKIASQGILETARCVWRSVTNHRIVRTDVRRRAVAGDDSSALRLCA